MLVICSLMLCHISRVCVLKMLASVFFAKVASINFVLDYTDMTRLCRVARGKPRALARKAASLRAALPRGHTHRGTYVPRLI